VSSTQQVPPAAQPHEPASQTSFWKSWKLQPLFRLGLSEETFFLLLAIVIGILSGLAVVSLRVLIDWCRLLLLGPAVIPAGLRVVVAPALTSLIVAVLVIWFFPRTRGSGVNQTKEALYIYDGYIPLRTAIGKFITSVLAIGAGHSLGPEDPSLQIGAALASTLGRKLHLSRDRLRLVAPIGAASGLAAAFNAPISAVLFVIEEVIGRWSAGVLGSVVLAAVSSVVVSRWFLGSEPLFRIPPVQLVHPLELLAYAVLGLIGGIASVIFAKGIAALRIRLKSFPRWTQYLQPAIAGLLIGLIGYLGAPQVMGAGYEFIDRAMHDQYTWDFLGILTGLKILSTTLSFTSGTPGGMFAPALFVGAMLGGAVGGVERHFFPHLTGSVGTYCLVGMGVLFAGFLRAPMTSVFMVLEVSGNYSIIVPVMIANTIAYLISRGLQSKAIFDVLSRQDGVDLPSLEEQREQALLRVEDAMRPPPAMVLESDELLGAALSRIKDSSASDFIVRLAPTGWASVSKDALLTWVKEGKADFTIGSVLHSPLLPYLHPDQPLDTALPYFHQASNVPVVHRADFRKLQGIICLQDVLATYQKGGG
jgi:CIC family chloride channel protein